MHDALIPKLPKWPFFIGDALMVGLAGYICYQSKASLGPMELVGVVVCAALGTWLGVLPFLSEQRALVKVAQAEHLASAVAQIQNLDRVAAQICSATNHWRSAQDAADQTARAAREIAGGVAGELKRFTEIMQRSNDGEKTTLKLEVEKARRAEGEWLQILVHLLDHTFALHTAAVRSGQANVIRQVDLFQNACRDTARRVGLIPFIAEPGETYDAERHQADEPDAHPAADAVVVETLGTGYTFQGRLLRPAIVRLQAAPPGAQNGDLDLSAFESVKSD